LPKKNPGKTVLKLLEKAEQIADREYEKPTLKTPRPTYWWPVLVAVHRAKKEVQLLLKQLK